MLNFLAEAFWSDDFGIALYFCLEQNYNKRYFDVFKRRPAVVSERTKWIRQMSGRE